MKYKLNTLYRGKASTESYIAEFTDYNKGKYIGYFTFDNNKQAKYDWKPEEKELNSCNLRELTKLEQALK